MKTNKIFIVLTAFAAMFAASCQKNVITDNPYKRNVGEEILSVSIDNIEFLGRGASQDFIVSASYDARIEAPEWVTLTSLEVPGDGREFTVTATAPANSALGSTARSGEIVITTKTLSKTIAVSQPYYERPACPLVIKDKSEFVFFIEQCAPFYEVGEEVELLTDIDMTGVTLANNAELFKGVLNGNGFKISNWNATSALFAKNQGAINNLNIDASCTLKVPASGADAQWSLLVGQNYGTISGCEVAGSIILDDSYTYKNYVGGMAGYNYTGAKIVSCVNKGEIRFAAQSSTANAYLGGITGYSFGSIESCENYGPINGVPSAFSAVYFIGGITPRQETGDLKYNINHKEGKIYTNAFAATGKCYIGGIVGYVEGAPVTTANQNYADIEVNIKSEEYIGGLQGWQAKVNDATKPNANVFEGSIVNCNIIAYTKGKAVNGNNPCNSAGLVTGRFSGQSGQATTLHYGTADMPIKASGSIYCLATKTKKVASARDYQALLDGDGSKTSVNIGAIPECDYGNILYEVRGDGQTGDPEDMVVKTDAVKLTVPFGGGEAKFNARGNYAMTITPEVDWLSVDAETVAGDGEYHEVTVTALANDHTYAREGTITVKMPMGSTEIITVSQAGNLTLPESVELSETSLSLDPVGAEPSTFTVTANYDAAITTDVDWLTITPATVPGTESAQTVKVLAQKNQTGAVRTATITVTLPKGASKTIAVSQDEFKYTPKPEIGTVADFLDFITYAAITDFYPSTYVVKLTADIDLKGKVLEPVSSFVATLDGQGHSIKNWACTAPMFTSNAGVVKGIVIDKSCTIAGDINVSFLVATNNGTVSGCANNAEIKITGNFTNSGRIAPFVCSNAGKIVDCVNNGNLSFAAADDQQAMYVCGICGTCTTGASIEGCTNNGNITYTTPAGAGQKYKRLAGITGMADQNGIVIKNCTNSGNITITLPEGTSVKNIRNGGIVGEVKNVFEMSGCRNFGNLSCGLNNSAVYLGGLVGYFNSVSSANTFFQGCAVNCTIEGACPATTTKNNNVLECCGLIFGSGPASAKAVHTLGTADAPIKVAGTLKCGESSITAAADNFQHCLNGAKCGNNLTDGFENVVYNAKFEAVTK